MIRRVILLLLICVCVNVETRADLCRTCRGTGWIKVSADNMSTYGDNGKGVYCPRCNRTVSPSHQDRCPNCRNGYVSSPSSSSSSSSGSSSSSITAYGLEQMNNQFEQYKQDMSNLIAQQRQEEIAQMEKKKKTTTTIVVIVGIVVLLIAVVAFLWYRARRRKNKSMDMHAMIEDAKSDLRNASFTDTIEEAKITVETIKQTEIGQKVATAVQDVRDSEVVKSAVEKAKNVDYQGIFDHIKNILKTLFGWTLLLITMTVQFLWAIVKFVFKGIGILFEKLRNTYYDLRKK